MPIIKMPDGAEVNFPDDMPKEQIKSIIASKFPDVMAKSQPKEYNGIMATAEKAVTPAYKALAGIGGLGGDIETLGRMGGAKIAELVVGKEIPGSYQQEATLPTTQDVEGVLKAGGVPFREAESPQGRVAQDIATGVLTPLAGKKLAAMTGIGMGASGATREAGGSELEQIAAGLATPLAAGGIGKVAGGLGNVLMPKTGKDLIQKAMKNVTPEDIARARKTQTRAAELGTKVTGPEALGNRELLSWQRTLEETPDAEGAFKFIEKSRKGEAERAINKVTGAIGERPDPIATGIRAKEAAEGSIKGGYKKANIESNPLYEQAYSVEIPKKDIIDIIKRPSIQRAFKEAQTIAKEEGGSVADLRSSSFKTKDLDYVKQALDDMIENSKGEFGRSTNETRALMSTKSALVSKIDELNPIYKDARRVYQEGIAKYVDPLNESTIGQLTKSDNITTALNRLTDPKTSRPETIGMVANELKKQDKNIYRDLVKLNLENEASTALKDLVGGEKVNAGRAFRNALIGEPQKKANFKAMIGQLDNGKEVYRGMLKMFDVFDAQARRLPVGSPTSEKLAKAKTLGGGIYGRAISIVDDFLTNKSVEKNAKFLADVFTDPDSVGKLEQLSKLDPKSRKSMILLGEILGSRIDENEGE